MSKGTRIRCSAGRLLAACLCAFAWSATPSAAEDGVTADRILIGQTAGETGQVAAQVKELTAAARAYFAWVNKRGGVNGRQIEMISIDDGYDGKRAADNARKLITGTKVFALAMSRGTPPSEALLPVVKEFEVPLVGPATGALTMHAPVNRYVFNIRAKYQTEATRIIEHLASVGTQRIAVVYQDNSFGKDALAGFEQGLKAKGIVPVAMIPLDGAKPETSVPGTVEALAKADLQAVAIAGPLKPTADLIKALRAKGVYAQYLTLSNLSADGFIKELGDAAPGVIVTQVMPAPGQAAMPVVKEFLRVIAENPSFGAVPSYTAMEGYVTARVIVEGLRRAGKNPTREGFVSALEGMRDFDLGGFTIGYSPSNHSGSTFIDITIIGKDRTFRR